MEMETQYEYVTTVTLSVLDWEHKEWVFSSHLFVKQI